MSKSTRPQTRPSSTPIGQAMEERAAELGLLWEEVAVTVGLSSETLRRIRSGKSGPARHSTRRAIERALWWAPGAYEEAAAGKEPRTLDPSVSYATVSDVPAMVRSGQPDYVRELRKLRKVMGPAAFWGTVAEIEREESTQTGTLRIDNER